MTLCHSTRCKIHRMALSGFRRKAIARDCGLPIDVIHAVLARNECSREKIAWRLKREGMSAGDVAAVMKPLAPIYLTHQNDN